MAGERDYYALARAVRAKLVTRTLPLESPSVVWGGRGSGKPCSACDGSITAAELEYEVDATDGGTLRFHHDCLAIWRAEVIEPPVPAATAPPAA